MDDPARTPEVGSAWQRRLSVRSTYLTRVACLTCARHRHVRLG